MRAPADGNRIGRDRNKLDVEIMGGKEESDYWDKVGTSSLRSTLTDPQTVAIALGLGPAGKTKPWSWPRWPRRSRRTRSCTRRIQVPAFPGLSDISSGPMSDISSGPMSDISSGPLSDTSSGPMLLVGADVLPSVATCSSAPEVGEEEARRRSPFSVMERASAVRPSSLF